MKGVLIMLENENVEFKTEFTENIYKEIVSFLNSNGGTIYVGYSDDGNLVGLDDAKIIEERLSNGIIQKITPDASVFVSINLNVLADKEFIVINVSKGINVYSLKDKGILKGTYVRNGSCSLPASEETVKQMIIKKSNISFETSVSLNQELTFNYIKRAFDEIDIDINNKNIMKNLNITTQDGKYTNLGLLLSDQNPFTLKVAVYETKNKRNFLDRKEFSGSLLEVFDKTIDYLKINSATKGIINSSVREDFDDFPEFILREITLNSLIHRDYSIFSSNIINIYQNDSIEFINYGSLYGNITLEDILDGLSASRNPRLQSIFTRIKRVEAIGSGLRRTNAYYKEKGMELIVKALPASFIVSIPIMDRCISVCGNDYSKILEFVDENGIISREEASKIIGKGRSTTANVMNKMVENNILRKINGGPNTRYIR